MTRINFFHADWCGPCSEQKPIIDEIEADHDIDVDRFDIDDEDGMEVANDYSVRSVPTTVIVDGDEITQFSGLTPKDEIVEEL